MKAFALERGPTITYVQEGLLTWKEAYVLKCKGLFTFKEGLHIMFKRAYELMYLKEGVCFAILGPVYFKEGLRMFKRAYWLERGPTYLKEGLCFEM